MRFEEVAQKLRSQPGVEHGAGAGEFDIESAETALGIAFPITYRQFLRSFGWCAISSVEVFGLGKDVPKWLDVVRLTLSERNEAHPPLRKSLLPFYNDGGGNLTCFDTGASADGRCPIVRWDHELGDDQIPELISGTFPEWLNDQLRSSSD